MRKFKGQPEGGGTKSDASIPVDTESRGSKGDEGTVGALRGAPAEDEVEEIFPEEHLEPFRGLLFLGDMTREVWYGGHCFVIRTLREGEILRIGQLIRDYRETLTEIEARKVYTVAAAVESIDGMPLSVAYKKGYDVIPDKAEEVKQWYPSVIAYLHKAYVEMEMTAIEVANAIKK